MERVLTGSSQPEFPVDSIGLEGFPAPSSDKATALQDAEQRKEFLHSMLDRTELDIKYVSGLCSLATIKCNGTKYFTV